VYTMSGCTMCGACCRKYGMRLEASQLDIARWRLDGREDILACVGVEFGGSGEVAGGKLWVNPDGSRVSECPFTYELDGKCYCGIHDAKPEVCATHFCIKYYDDLTG